jgi:hypothetical protein
MYRLIEQFRPWLRIRPDRVRVDANVVRLHQWATVFILSVAGFFLTCKQCFGDPIHCMVDGVPKRN